MDPPTRALGTDGPPGAGMAVTPCTEKALKGGPPLPYLLQPPPIRDLLALGWRGGGPTALHSGWAGTELMSLLLSAEPSPLSPFGEIRCTKEQLPSPSTAGSGDLQQRPAWPS